MPTRSEIIIENYNKIKHDTLDPRDKKSKITKHIITRLKKSSKKEIQKLGSEIEINYQQNPKATSQKLYKLVEDIKNNSKISIKYEITDAKYQELIKARQNKKISKQESEILEKMLFSKVCNCVKKRMNQATADWLIGKDKDDLDDKKYNPYAICTSSVYNSRGFKRKKSFKDCKKYR